MKVIGTAGHVDHGKSTLIHALTGIHPDRLKEEQERQLTIDLGFAWMTLPAGESVGIIDVPGHIDFIENMLAGVGGIDAALFVIAADEGIMPQTEEHMAILDLLEIDRGVVALTKSDLVEPEWLELVIEESRELLVGKTLQDAPIIPVSAMSRHGLGQLIQALEEVLAQTPERPDRGRPRLPVDRAFTISGFGTVVTGTLVDGSLSAGDPIEILPEGRGGRIRGLQTHNLKIDHARPGSRVAANLTGINVDEIVRGEVVVRPGDYRPTTMLDVRFRLLPTADAPLKHNQEVKLFLGSAQRMAVVRVLGTSSLRPGEAGWLQLMLREPIVAARGDRYILRRPSPGATLGGGRVADPHPKRRHRLKDLEVPRSLENLLEGSPAEVLAEALEQLGPVPLAAATRRAGLPAELVEPAVGELAAQGYLVILGPDPVTAGEDALVTTRSHWERLVESATRHVQQFHARNPLRAGMPREELRSRLSLEPTLFAAAVLRLIDSGALVDQGSTVRDRKFEVRLTNDERARVDALIERFQSAPFSPPSFKESTEAASEELVAYLLESGQLVRASPEILFHSQAYKEMVARVQRAFSKQESVTVAEVRDMFNTSRKYALALMEHLDTIGITVREGDVRRLARGLKAAQEPPND